MRAVGDNARRITEFYDAFARKDGRAMAASYAPGARFSDPVFPELDAREAGGMWRMFCERPGSDLAIAFRDVTETPSGGKAHWDATYTFPLTGRKVRNEIDATFEMKDGLFVRHVDHFDFWRWSRMALGATGVLLGWTPIVRNRVRAQARANLERFLAASG
jgi:hypothetical protein